MIPFKTTPDQVIQLAKIVTTMSGAGVETEFLARAAELAATDQGVFDLMDLWATVADEAERDEILAHLQDSLDDYAERPESPQKKPHIPFDDLGAVVRGILSEKAKLRELIDRHGGVSAVARRSGIPQPSLSRLLNSASMPRKTTLYRIAEALQLSEKEIVMEWVR